MKYYRQSRKHKIIQYTLFFIIGIALAVSFLLYENPINVSAKSTDPTTNETVDLDDHAISEFEGVNFIPNKNYFYLNPGHHSNNKDDSTFGTCTTVAMQMLMGYHNYYSDRRLIPATTSDGKRFLSENYANFDQNPVIMESRNTVLGYPSLGTEDAFFDELCDLEIMSSSIGQMFPFVKSAANKFIDKYSNTIKDDVNISYKTFNYEEAHDEIDAGRPIMLGYSGLNGSKSFHVVVAYGYATYNGTQGFIVHYGHWGDKSQIWLPSKYFGYQVTMTVDHNHSMEITDGNYIGAYKILQCTQCGCEMLDSYYNVSYDEKEITGIKYTDILDISIPAKINGNEITTIAKSSFENTNIRHVTIADGVTEVGEKAFKNCKNLQSVTLPDDLSIISKETFAGCEDLTEITLPTKLTSIEEGAFLDCHTLRHVIIPTYTLEKIGDKAFMNCEFLKIVEIFGDLLEIGSYAFYNTRLESVWIPNNVKIIKDYAFSECDQLTTIYIPDSVTEIGEGLFMGARSLKEVTLSKSLISIPKKTFYECSNLETMVIPDGVKTIKDNAFSGCDQLTTINIPDSVTEIGTGLFMWASSLREVTLSKNLISIPDKTFSDCSKLETVVIPDSVKTIKDYAFSGCDQLTTINIPDSVTEIGEGLFMEACSLKEVTLSKSLTSIPDSVFYQCSTINNVVIPEKVASIGKRTFYRCRELNNISLPDALTNIGTYAFADCVNLKEIELPTELSEIPDYLFYNCDLYDISIPRKVLRIGNMAFYGCESLIHVTIPNISTVVEKYAFSNTGIISLMKITDADYTLTQSGADFTIYFDKSYEALPKLTITINDYPAEEIVMQNDSCTFKSRNVKFNAHNYIACSFTQRGYVVIGDPIEIDIFESIGKYEEAYRTTVNQCQEADVCMLIPYESEYYFKIVYSLYNRLLKDNITLGTMSANNDCGLQAQQLSDLIELGKSIIMIWEVERGYLSFVDTENTSILLFDSNNSENWADYIFLSDYYLAGYEQACYIIENSVDYVSKEVELFVPAVACDSDAYTVFYAGFTQAINDYSSELLINEQKVSDKEEIFNIIAELSAFGNMPAAIVYFDETLFDVQSFSNCDLSETLIITFAFDDETLYHVNDEIISAAWYFNSETLAEAAAETVIQITEGNNGESIYYIDFTVIYYENVSDYLI